MSRAYNYRKKLDRFELKPENAKLKRQIRQGKIPRFSIERVRVEGKRKRIWKLKSTYLALKD